MLTFCFLFFHLNKFIVLCLDYVALVQLWGQFLKDSRLLAILIDGIRRQTMSKLQETHIWS